MSDLDFWSGGILHRLFKARLVNFNRAILRARLALALLYPSFLAPACCTEPIDFSRWSIQLKAS
jgi:hypothetical protein